SAAAGPARAVSGTQAQLRARAAADRMKYISSRDNALYKQLLRLASGRPSRDAANLVLLEGLNLCQAWLQHHGAPVRAVFDAERLDRGGPLRALAEAVGDAASIACEPRLARG